LKTLRQLADLVDGMVIGDENILVYGVGSVFQGAPPGSITFIGEKRLLAEAEKTSAAAVITPPGITASTKPLLAAANPKIAFAKIASLFVENTLGSREISPKAHIHSSVVLGDGVSVHPFAVISENAVLGNETIIGPGVFIGKNVKIGGRSRIHANAVIDDNTVIGCNVIIHSGAVIGSDGFGFIACPEGQMKVPQLGNVVIEDDVEICANATVDRATAGPTVIGKGSKLGDDVHVGHNAAIGRDCILVAQAAVGGSAKIGGRTTIAGKAAVTDHAEIGKNVTLSACAIALKDIKDGSFVSGHPAIDHQKDYRIRAAARRLPELLKKVAQMEKKITELESKLNKKL